MDTVSSAITEVPATETVNPMDGSVVVHPAGPLDRSGAVRLTLQLIARLARGCKRIILDFKKVPYIDSDGIRALLKVMQQHTDVPFEVHNANQRIQRILTLTRVTDKLLLKT
ncbi:MAG: STAS domain-containing protein [Armatimonadetes bacterium]|nr:STAS domain-containing protein [Armatimonadota bacterium]